MIQMKLNIFKSKGIWNTIIYGVILYPWNPDQSRKPI